MLPIVLSYCAYLEYVNMKDVFNHWTINIKYFLGGEFMKNKTLPLGIILIALVIGILGYLFFMKILIPNMM